MGYTTEHRGRRAKVFVPGTGQFLNSTCIRTALEPTRATRILDIVLSSQKELVDNVEIKEPLGSSDHNQMHFNINVKSDKTKVKQCRRDFRKGNYKEIRKRLTRYRLEVVASKLTI